MHGSEGGVVRRHAAPNGAWLPGKDVAIDMPLLAELAVRFQGAGPPGMWRMQASRRTPALDSRSVPRLRR